MFLVTGSSGFVGRSLVTRLKADGFKVREVSRQAQTSENTNVVHIPVIDKDTDWSSALSDVSVVVHCAARAHRMNDPEDSLQKYKNVNYHGAVQLARECEKHGVRRLVFVSTIKVCAESTPVGQVVSPDAALNPTDWYSQTKADAEVALKKMTLTSPLELVIVRPPLVYGPGAKGNLQRLVSLLSKQLPLPLGAINNRRSLVGLENLVDFLLLTSLHPKANGHVFNVSDGEPVSTTHILKVLSKALNRRSFLVPVPPKLLKLVAKLTGTSAYTDRLLSNLEVDSTNCFEILEWQPPLSVDESITSLVR